MRTHMHYRLAGLAAAIAATLALGTGYLVSGPAAHANTAAAQACPDGTHWDTILKTCL